MKSDWIYVVPGILLILFGIAVWTTPAILVALVATFFVLSGMWAIHVGWRFRRIAKRAEYSGGRSVDESPDEMMLRWWFRRGYRL
jgi:hypothetical protein